MPNRSPEVEWRASFGFGMVMLGSVSELSWCDVISYSYEINCSCPHVHMFSQQHWMMSIDYFEKDVKEDWGLQFPKQKINGVIKLFLNLFLNWGIFKLTDICRNSTILLYIFTVTLYLSTFSIHVLHCRHWNKLVRYWLARQLYDFPFFHCWQNNLGCLVFLREFFSCYVEWCKAFVCQGYRENWKH